MSPTTPARQHAVEVLLAIDATLYVVDATAADDRQLSDEPFRHVRVSPNGRYVALYTDDGRVWVVSSDLQQKLSEYSSRARTVPQDVQWCGNHSVALAWEDEVHMVGPNGAALKSVSHVPTRLTGRNTAHSTAAHACADTFTMVEFICCQMSTACASSPTTCASYYRKFPVRLPFRTMPQFPSPGLMKGN